MAKVSISPPFCTSVIMISSGSFFGTTCRFFRRCISFKVKVLNTYDIRWCCMILVLSLCLYRLSYFHHFGLYCNLWIWTGSEELYFLLLDSFLISRSHPSATCSTATAPRSPLGPACIHGWQVERMKIHWFRSI